MITFGPGVREVFTKQNKNGPIHNEDFPSSQVCILNRAVRAVFVQSTFSVLDY